jgi:predicted O-linked N-acetylglucosamine transferase (SPINDLY family)
MCLFTRDHSIITGTQTLLEYEERAVTLALDPLALVSLRARLDDHRRNRSAPLFAIDEYARSIESAFVTMWANHERGR